MDVKDKKSDETGRTLRGPAKKWMLRSAVALAVVIGAVYAAPRVMHALSHESTDDAFVEGTVVPVSAEVKGRVVRVFVRNNQPVRAGDPLLEISGEDYSAVVAEREEKSLALTAQKREVEASVEEKRRVLRQAHANLEAASAEERLAAKELQRYRGLLEERLVSQSQYDRAEARWSVTSARLEAARSAVAEAEAAIGTLGARLKTQSSMIRGAEASLSLARLDLKRTVVVAPVSGRIAKKNVDPGKYVQSGQPLMSIVDDRDLWVVANFKETQIAKMRVGQPVTITVDAYPGAVFRGRLDSFQPGTGSAFSLLPPENATGNFVKVVQRVPVKIVLDSASDPRHPLWPGLSVIPSVNVSSRGETGTRM